MEIFKNSDSHARAKARDAKRNGAGKGCADTTFAAARGARAGAGIAFAN
ncbi:MAG TPA: hypothetical protein VGX24_04250 [Pyrinomonadaceae bacterium]|nr:hypothetical protein [Pyrinomonadaceae bacterium]